VNVKTKIVPAAYKGANLWRAAVHVLDENDKLVEEPRECTLLMTAHIFDGEDESIKFAKLFIDGSQKQRELLELFGRGAGMFAGMSLTRLVVELIESYLQQDESREREKK
jgi:hypothetical protein